MSDEQQTGDTAPLRARGIGGDALVPWGEHEDGRRCQWHQRLGAFVTCLRDQGQVTSYDWRECTRSHTRDLLAEGAYPEPDRPVRTGLPLLDDGGTVYPEPVQQLAKQIHLATTGPTGDRLVGLLAQALRSTATGVEIERDDGMDTCRVTREGEVLFDGISHKSLLEQQPHQAVAVAVRVMSRALGMPEGEYTYRQVRDRAERLVREVAELREAPTEAAPAVIAREPGPYLASDLPVGTVVRGRLKDERGVYVAEVRRDFGFPAWGGSWHGFTLPVGATLTVEEFLHVPGEAPRPAPGAPSVDRDLLAVAIYAGGDEPAWLGTVDGSPNAASYEIADRVHDHLAEVGALREADPTTGPVTVAQDWLRPLPVQQQCVVLAAIRGPDGMRKHHPAKALIRAYRATVLNGAVRKAPLVPGDDTADTYMDPTLLDPDAAIRVTANLGLLAMGAPPPTVPPWRQAVEDYLSAVDEVPHHYHLHLMHGAQIVGYHHPDEHVARIWRDFYWDCCSDMHLPTESREQMDERLDDFGTSPGGRQS